MSQRPVDSHDEANTNKDGQSIALPPVNIHQQDEEPQARHDEASSSDATAPPAGEKFAQQSSTPYPPTQPTDARPTPPPSRSLGVHNILNPAEPEDVKPRSSPAGPASLAVSTREQAHNKADPRPSTRQKRGLQSPSLSSNEGSDQLRPRKTLYRSLPSRHEAVRVRSIDFIRASSVHCDTRKVRRRTHSTNADCPSTDSVLIQPPTTNIDSSNRPKT